MPLYNFKCSKCENVIELNKKISDRDDTESETCPECSTTGFIVRLVSAPLVGYSIATKGYGRGAGEGWKDVLRKIENAPGASKGLSSFL